MFKFEYKYKHTELDALRTCKKSTNEFANLIKVEKVATVQELATRCQHESHVGTTYEQAEGSYEKWRRR